MKKIFLFLFVSLMAISLALAQGSDTAGSGEAQSGQGTVSGTQTNTDTQTQNQGEEPQIQTQARVRSGDYINAEGEQMQIQTQNGVRLRVGNAEANCSLELMQEQSEVQNRIRLMTQLSNGRNAEIKVMPNVASEKAIERLRLKACNSENNCAIELKEVGSGQQVKAAYEVKAQKEAKILGLFKIRMRVQGQIDAENGEVIQIKKPWWSFLATE
ncbi:MAG: hypothetical protein JSW73_05410 [Candidatus Woesearchaeota archaeon]|nr:MAG: hypothetical protein JSW73_05410 [Candidatus Woesearchaeota archaeon]